MTVAYSLMMVVETAPADPPPIDVRMIRLLLDRAPEIDRKPDGSLTYRYRMGAPEISDARGMAERSAALPTSEGLMACLSALAKEALDLGLSQASWAIDLATQMIRLQQDGPEPGTARRHP